MGGWVGWCLAGTERHGAAVRSRARRAHRPRHLQSRKALLCTRSIVTGGPYDPPAFMRIRSCSQQHEVTTRVLHEDTPRHTLRELRVRHGYSGYSGAQAGVTVAQEQQRNLDGSGSARRAEVHGSSERFESADTKQHLKDKGPEGRRMRHARRSPAGRSSFSTLGRALSTASAARPLTADNPQQIPIGSLQRSGALAKWSPVQPPRSWISTSAPLQAATPRL